MIKRKTPRIHQLDTYKHITVPITLDQTF